VAESFRKEMGTKAVLAGVVMRSDLVLDGVALGWCTVGGMDATEKIIQMWRDLRRDDINVFLLSGAIISWFNVIDLNLLFQSTGIPLISLTYEESEGIRDLFQKHFPEGWDERVRIYDANGSRSEVNLRSGYSVYVRCLGIEFEEARRLLDKFTLHGRYPEPIRVAKLVARSVLRFA